KFNLTPKIRKSSFNLSTGHPEVTEEERKKKEQLEPTYFETVATIIASCVIFEGILLSILIYFIPWVFVVGFSILGYVVCKYEWRVRNERR
ncbi:MAG TPA: hypothetical protein VIH61_09120, partial [Waddliaceae bacterium]